MSINQQNRHIARLIVGAMTIDGDLSKSEQEKLAKTLASLGLEELIADVGAAIEEDHGAFNMFAECRELVASLGRDADELAPVIFRLITDVIASDRYVSSQEAAYLSGLAKRLNLSTDQSKKIFKAVMTERRGRLEIAGSDVDEYIHPHLKELLSFCGAEELVGEVNPDSLEEMMHQAKATSEEEIPYSLDDVENALEALGLNRNATLEEAEEIWREAIEQLNLNKMLELGETFVTAALNRITRLNDAYRTVLHFHQQLEKVRRAANEAERLEKQIERDKAAPNTRNALAGKLETELTGVGVVSPYKE